MRASSEQSGTKLRGVGIGAGYFSRFQYEAWSRIPQVDLVAVADLDEGKAQAAAEQFGIPHAYTDYREMLDREQPDFVDIITQPDAHLELCTYAAQLGIHVICQKPLAPTYEEAQQIVQNVEGAGVRFMVHENWRWQPWYREVKRLHHQGVLGELFSISFCMRTGDGWGDNAYLDRQPYFREYPRLFVFETGVHFIDAFRFLLGEVQTVYARLRRLNDVIAGEDSGQIVFGFENGATAVLDANRYNELDTSAPVRYTFGTMRVDASNASLCLHPDGRMRIKPLGQPAYDHEYPHIDRGLGGDSCYFVQRHFVDGFLNGTPFESGGADYLKTLRVVEACYESTALDQVVRIDAPEAQHALLDIHVEGHA